MATEPMLGGAASESGSPVSLHTQIRWVAVGQVLSFLVCCTGALHVCPNSNLNHIMFSARFRGCGLVIVPVAMHWHWPASLSARMGATVGHLWRGVCTAHAWLTRSALGNPLLLEGYPL